jgi:transposase
MRPLSGDLRVRFGRALDRGLSARAAAQLLEVSAATGTRWAHAWRTTGAIEPGKVGGHRPLLLEGERDWLLARIEREKDLTLHALLAALRDERGVVVSCDTLWRYLKRCGKTFKKRRSSPRSRSGPMSPADVPAGSGSSAGSMLGGSSSSMRPGPRPT